MSRTRIVKGVYTKISQGNHLMFAEGNIITSASEEVNQLGTDLGVKHGSPNKIEDKKDNDFNISFSLNRNEKTMVPLGILDFNNKYENPYFAFNYALSLSNVESLEFEVKDADGNIIYEIINLQPVVITASKLPMIRSKLPALIPDSPEKSWGYNDVFKEYALSSPDYTTVGSYVIHWDGFDNNDVYDSTRFNDKKLTAKITASKAGKKKSLEVSFSTSYKEVDWVDVKIDRKHQKIYTTLRVDLKDGGANGLGKEKYKDPMDDPRYPAFRERYIWETIPRQVIKNNGGKLPLEVRTRSFSDLEKLAITGLNYHWGRNSDHAEAKNVKIVDQEYQFCMNAVNVKENSMDDVSLIYNTNSDWMRSGNPGTVEDPISFVGNIISREAICYNVGYIKTGGWRYRLEENEKIEFEETSAHEIGHTILKAYGGTFYSYGHKGTVNTVTQHKNSMATTHPKKGEIDLMFYYTDRLEYKERNKIVAAKRDVLSLMWLTKIEIK
ncbi:hypothetical protein ABIB40_003664 [Pedobacter sp. UYP30]|uniref:hypothetical protein n=1 Tax=Pedobacter sp. UYP30 TaxID=1756400 RepID=UPI0033939B8C